MAAFSGLATTCDTLPIVPLLQSLAAAQCPVGPLLPFHNGPDHPGVPAEPETPQRFGGWLDTALDCSLAQLKAHVSEVDLTCCTAESGNCVDGLAPSMCSVECGGKMLSMYTACPTTLNLVFVRRTSYTCCCTCESRDASDMLDVCIGWPWRWGIRRNSSHALQYAVVLPTAPCRGCHRFNPRQDRRWLHAAGRGCG